MITPEQQSYLRNKYNPDGSNLRKHQLRMLDMLKYIDKICRDNNIKYWLSSGTCIGAVRHGGFIPWDDDADIELFKPDYIKLIKILKQQKDSIYQLQDHSSDPEYLAPYAKLRDTTSVIKETNSHDLHYLFNGIFVDIFCIEPSTSLFLTRAANYIQRNIFKLTAINNDTLRHLLSGAAFFLFHKILFKPISIIGRTQKKVFRHIPGAEFEPYRHFEDIKDTIYTNFEDTQLPIPINSHNYLSKIYGDYMKIPDLRFLQNHII